MNANLKSAKYEVTRIRKGEKDVITKKGERWNQNGVMYLHSQSLDEDRYAENFEPAENVCYLNAYAIEDQKNSYKELKNDSVEKSWFHKEYDNMKVEKSVKDEITTFRIYYTYNGVNEKGE